MGLFNTITVSVVQSDRSFFSIGLKRVHNASTLALSFLSPPSNRVFGLLRPVEKGSFEKDRVLFPLPQPRNVFATHVGPAMKFKTCIVV